MRFIAPAHFLGGGCHCISLAGFPRTWTGLFIAEMEGGQGYLNVRRILGLVIASFKEGEVLQCMLSSWTPHSRIEGEEVLQRRPSSWTFFFPGRRD
jgi:hypothetical protein